jgi:hypothetical protein
MQEGGLECHEPLTRWHQPAHAPLHKPARMDWMQGAAQTSSNWGGAVYCTWGWPH